MAITEVRIDDRLIHGQVSTLWVPSLQIERILIVDDTVAFDEDRKAVLKFATPPQAKLSIFDSAKAAEKLTRKIDEGIRVMIVCASPQPLVRMAEHGYTVERVTVANMSGREGASELTKTAYVTNQDLEDLASLVNRGVDVGYQPTPTSRRESLSETITQRKKDN